MQPESEESKLWKKYLALKVGDGEVEFEDHKYPYIVVSGNAFKRVTNYDLRVYIGAVLLPNEVDKPLFFCTEDVPAEYRENIFWGGLKLLALGKGEGAYEECARLELARVPELLRPEYCAFRAQSLRSYVLYLCSEERYERDMASRLIQGHKRREQIWEQILSEL